LFVGGSVEIAPAQLNAYTKYYEARAYLQGPFRSRSSDLVSVITTRSVHSQDTLRNLIAQGKTVWTNTNTVTASYSMHAMRGTYFSGGLTYLQGPAVTPRVPNALVISLSTSLFF
jgi:porin